MSVAEGGAPVLVGGRHGRVPDLERLLVPAAVLAAAVAAAAAAALGPRALVFVLGLAALAAALRWPTGLLVGLLYVGIFKREAVSAGVPFDLTIGLAVLLAAVCFQRWLAGRTRPIPYALVAVFALIAGWLAVSLAWTPVSDYGGEKAARFATITLIATFAPFFLIDDRRDVRQLLWWTFGVAVFAAGLAVVSPPSGDEGRLGIGEGESKSTIFAARLLCTGAIVAFLAGPLYPARWMRAAGPLAGIALAIVAAGVGSRGPILALVLALACTLVAQLFRGAGRIVPMVVMIVAAVAVFQFVSLPETSVQRISTAADDPVGTVQREGRGDLYGGAVDLTDDHPLRGAGSGGFYAYTTIIAVEPARYPHNIVLELSSETGLIPAAALIAAVLWVLASLYRRAWRLKSPVDSQLMYVAAALVLLNVFAAQFSGDLNDNRTFFAFLALGWLLGRQPLQGADERRTAGG